MQSRSCRCTTPATRGGIESDSDAFVPAQGQALLGSIGDPAPDTWGFATSSIHVRALRPCPAGRARPGGLYGKVTPENFGKGATDYRNPLVAEIMHHLGFAQRFGLGVPLTREALVRNGNPEPEFSFQPTQVGVVVRAAE